MCSASTSSSFNPNTTIMGKTQLPAVPIILLGALSMVAILTLVKDEITSPLLYHTLRGNTNYRYLTDIFIPPSLDVDSQRGLSLNLGGGMCKWMPPVYEVPENVDFHKTLIAGFPSGDKRMAYLQMEALAGLPAKDEWDFAYLGMSNHPFIKANYPHHEGIWGWGEAADQVILMIPNIRRSMVEYHDILWDIGYATTWEDASLMKDNLFGNQPQVDEYYEWRDARVMDEVHWYGWFIDYWMEGGLRRDIFTHKLTSKEHWDDILAKPFYTRQELAYENYVPNGTIVEPSFDEHCTNVEITSGCEPIAVISADKLLDYTEGPGETAAIASALMADSRTGQYVIHQEAWECIWTELIQSRKGPKIMTDRPGYESVNGHTYNFSPAMLEAMEDELTRLIDKYSGTEWNSKPTANRLVEILTEHRAAIQIEISEFHSGVRKLRLRGKDFLGPNERARRRDLKQRQPKDGTPLKRIDNSKYFIALEQKRFENKRLSFKRNNRKKLDGEETSSMSDGDFVEALSNAVGQIRTLQASGGMTKEMATYLVERVRQVAMEARVVLVEGDDVVIQ